MALATDLGEAAKDAEKVDFGHRVEHKFISPCFKVLLGFSEALPNLLLKAGC